MRLVDVARAVESVDADRRAESVEAVIVASWSGADLTGATHVHLSRAKYRGLLAPRCAKRAVLFLAARVVERARRTGSAVVAGHGDGGIIAALAAECARTELAFDGSVRPVRSVSFGAQMRYPVRADVCVVATRDARALYPVHPRRFSRFCFVGERDSGFYAQMALAVVSHRTVSVSAAEYASAIEAQYCDQGPSDQGPGEKEPCDQEPSDMWIVVSSE
jgi:hypothetical protein